MVDNEEVVVPTSCISDINMVPQFASNDTDITFFRPATTRTIAVAPSAEAPKKAEDTTSAAAPEKKAAEAPEKKEAEDATPPHKCARPPTGAHQIMRGTHRALKS